MVTVPDSRDKKALTASWQQTSTMSFPDITCSYFYTGFQLKLVQTKVCMYTPCCHILARMQTSSRFPCMALGWGIHSDRKMVHLLDWKYFLNPRGLLQTFSNKTLPEYSMEQPTGTGYDFSIRGYCSWDCGQTVQDGSRCMATSRCGLEVAVQ